MVHIKESSAQVVAGDAQAMTTALDLALLQQVRLCASIVETAADTKLGLAASQPVLAAMATGVSKLIDSRASMASAIKDMTIIQKRSNLAETSFGCPGGFWRTQAPSFASAAAEVEVAG